jgi:glycosyltransferase involved in cell wall biosynthesis
MLSSESAHRDLQAFMPRCLAQLHVVPFAVRPTFAIEDAAIAAAQARHGLAPGYIYLPNQFWQHKNHVLALEALALVVEGGTDLHLVLSGQALDNRDGRHPHLLTQMMKAPSLAGHVTVLGVIPYPDLLALMAGSRALLNPSLFEGWSTTVEEAKALGARMVLSDLPVHQEQAEGKAIFFDRNSKTDAARALREAAGLPIAPDAGRRAAAAKENLAAQQVYAKRLAEVFLAAASR